MKASEFRLLMTEDEWQANVVDRAELNGWWWWHDNFSRRNKAGLPDLILVRPPRLIFAELKKEKGVVSKVQKGVLAMLAQCPGVEVYVWRPSDEPEVERLLAR